jgi:hypothetical protein
MTKERAKRTEAKLTAEEFGRRIAEYVNRAPRKPSPTPEQINKANRELWGESAPPPVEAFNHPGLVPIVAEAHVMTLRATIREVEAKAESAIQSKRAKRPRKKKQTYRSLVIARMRIWREKDEGSFKQFLRSAEGGLSHGGFGGFAIKREGDGFKIETDNPEIAEPKKPISLSTLREWWSEAG